MTRKTVRIAMNGVTGRMGYRQHLVRSILAIREQGGLDLGDGTVLWPEPVLVGRREHALRGARRAARPGPHWSTDLDAVLADPTVDIYFDAQVTSAREEAIKKAIAAGKHIYTEKPTATGLDGALELARLAARRRASSTASSRTSSSCRACCKLKRLIDGGFFGRILSVRGEFGYWVFEGDWQAAQRPSWNYRAEDGGGIVVDMFPHWEYVLHELFGRVEAVQAHGRHPHPAALGRAGQALRRHRRRRRVRHLRARRRRDRPDQLLLGGARQPRRTGRVPGRRHRTAPRSPACATAASSTARPPPSRSGTPTSRPPSPSATSGRRSRTTPSSTTASRPSGSCSCGTSSLDAPYRWDLLAGARGVQLAELGLRSSAEGRRFDVPELSL